MEALILDPTTEPLTTVLFYFILAIIAAGLFATTIGYLGLLVCQARGREMMRRRLDRVPTTTVDKGQRAKDK